MGQRVSDEQILNAILSTSSQKLAAESLHITEQTLTKRLKNTKLKSKINEYRRNALEQTSNRIISQCDIAIDKLFNLLNSKNENTQLQAVCKILNFSAEYFKINDIVQRLDELELKFNKS